MLNQFCLFTTNHPRLLQTDLGEVCAALQDIIMGSLAP